ncbi:response regulator [Rhodococcus aetherivorans]|uniref:response regulator transcription factor n=1 Tax=Rhodococcus TaxID=1827 RepID=UPI0002D225F2|nr:MULTISPECIES: response regulator transcription factor [Rhodococcus]ETT26316.1 two component transcriptional regulator, LuxR family [Rhodococcus rhodochrous ATCC 21198]KDE10183.1 LuxR family transcriptional regulator [Rhodococcus aetherivorans]NGP28254.1 response regulator transcription factor [Rhodococcus aetherivorans]QPG44098.1 response regulator transcription factor [Rhodococcus sp. M8]CCW15367.1 regulatory protein, LuxR:Response regulator receiver [Rhodococcus aetherivorans]
MGPVVNAPAAIAVAVVDDHPVFRLGLVALLGTLDGIEVVAQASSVAEALEVITADVDVVLMDLELGDGSGIEATRQLLGRFPELRVLVVTMHEDEESLVASVRAGARGYLVKGADPSGVERAIRAVADGEVIVGAAVAAKAIGAMAASRTLAPAVFPELTDREREVLDLMARGHDNATIARRLVLSPKTVRNHVSNVLGKLGAADRSTAIVRAREAGLGA